MELAFLSAVEQARLVRTGEVSSVELVRASLERIERLDPTLNSFVTVAPSRPSPTAGLVDSTPGDAPFRGVPIGVKDLAPTAGIRTTYSSRAYADYVPDFDSAVVRRIREAGFVIVGKTNTPEFGTVAFTESELNGATRNPWNTRADTGRFERRRRCSPRRRARSRRARDRRRRLDSHPRVLLRALRAQAVSRPRLDGAATGRSRASRPSGPLTRTVEDAAHLLDVLAGYEPGDPWWAPPPDRPFATAPHEPPPRLRIAVTTSPPIDLPVDSGVRRAP